MNMVEQRFIIYWTICYYCETENRKKRRIMFLDTDLMPMDRRFPFMFRVDAENLLHSLELRHFREFFIEVKDYDYHIGKDICNFTHFSRTNGGTHYFETEAGEYLPEQEFRRKMGKDSSINDSLVYMNRYFSDQGNTDISFSSQEKRQLQIFTENFNELKKIKLKSPSLRLPATPYYSVFMNNTEIELKNYVLVFRRIYSEDKQAGGSFIDLCKLMMAHTGTDLALLAEDSLNYFEDLKSTDIQTKEQNRVTLLGASCIYQLFEDYKTKVTIDEIVQLFFYTQYHHNPNPKRVQMLQRLKDFLHRPDAEDILKYIYLMALLNFNQLFFNTGQAFVEKYQAQYPEDKNPVKIKGLGAQGSTTEDLQRRSKFNMYKRSFANALWVEAGRPDCGQYGFEDEAERRMLLNLGRVRI
ncbi:hypothetical protein P0136_02770 [Lentisphaerota bacterium ZTH]|nr:hypothetical protein JYG24_06090 [Lentisphaerota bacterium]WET06924.1 hypothetical protein P0136_02770 [Lentisphaerota bacterium ZTH]